MKITVADKSSHFNAKTGKRLVPLPQYKRYSGFESSSVDSSSLPLPFSLDVAWPIGLRSIYDYGYRNFQPVIVDGVPCNTHQFKRVFRVNSDLRGDVLKQESKQAIRKHFGVKHDGSLGWVNSETGDDWLEVSESYKGGSVPKADARHAVQFVIGHQDVIVKSGHVNTSYRPKSRDSGGTRGVIKELSKSSVNRMKLTLRNVDPVLIKSILTLTYPKDFPLNGRDVKRHLDLMKRWLKRHGVGSGFWFLEFQKRGAPHFHMFLSCFPVGGVQAVSKAWCQIVGGNDENHLRWHLGELSGTPCLELMRNPHAASAYATKYATKVEQKAVPEEFEDVGRFWGYWGRSMRPVWNWFMVHGEFAREKAKSVVLSFRSAWSKNEALERFSNRPYISCTMWGGAAVLHELMQLNDFVPF